MQRAAESPALVKNQCSAALAALIKRGWLEFTDEEKADLMQQVDALAVQAGTTETRRAAIETLHAVVLEFSPSTASSMGLSWEAHEKCRIDMQEKFLFGFAQHTLTLAFAGNGGDPSTTSVCIASLKLLNSILTWDFSKSQAKWTTAASSSNNFRPTHDSLHVRPPSHWTDLLISDNVMSRLSQLFVATRNTIHSELAQSVRELVVLMCALDVFPNEKEEERRRDLGIAPGLKDAHLRRMLTLVVPCIENASAAVSRATLEGEEELIDCCRALLFAAKIHCGGGFERAGSGLPLAGGGSVFDLLANLTESIVIASGTMLVEEASWPLQTLEILLDMWIELLTDPCQGMMGSSPSQRTAAGNVFSSLVTRELNAVAAHAQEDAEDIEGGESVLEEWISRIGDVGRAAAPQSLHLLTKHVEGAVGQVSYHMSSGQDPTEALEHLCFLIEVSSIVLADAGEGETPLLPSAILEACTSAAAMGSPDPAEGLSRSLLTLTKACIQQVMSPRLMEVLVTAMARWADTYLIMDNGAPPALIQAYGDGAAVSQSLAQLAFVALTKFPGETNLHKLATKVLLPVLVRNSARRSVIVKSAAWNSLCSLVAEPNQFNLAPNIQRHLCRALCLATSGMQAGESASYIQSLASYTSKQLHLLAGKSATDLQQAEVMQHALDMLERLRGFVKATIPSNSAILLALIINVAPSLTALLRTYGGQQFLPTTLLLKLAAGVTDHIGSGLQGEQLSALFAWALELLRIYSQQQAGKVVTQAKSLQHERAEEQFADLTALICMLTHFTNCDCPPDQTAQIVFLGLDVVLPLIDVELLKFIKLRRSYFALLAHMIEIHPDRMAALPFDMFSRLTSTLHYAITVCSSDPELSEAVFEAIAAIAKYHVQAIRNGAPGLGANNAEMNGVTALGRLLSSIMQHVVFEDAGLLIVDFAAEAMLPLIIAEPSTFQGFAHQAGDQVTPAFSHLVQGGAMALDRPARQAFKTRFHDFSTKVRAALRTR
jgi:hypothetical protein